LLKKLPKPKVKTWHASAGQYENDAHILFLLIFQRFEIDVFGFKTNRLAVTFAKFLAAGRARLAFREY